MLPLDEVECAFFQIDDPGHFPLFALAPLEQLGLLRPGSIFENRRYSGQLDVLRTRQVTGLTLKDMSQFNTTGRGEYIRENRFTPGSRVIDQSMLAQRWVNNFRHQGLTYHVPSGEIFRFYFGAISLGAASFMSLAVSDQEGVGLVDPEHTRELMREWERRQIPVPLRALDSPYREITRPILDYVKSLRTQSPRDVLTVYGPNVAKP